jgi:four helix bundle protein
LLTFDPGQHRGRSGDAELARFMLVAMGSASELEYHLLLAHDLGYLAKDYQVLSHQTQRGQTHALYLHKQASPQQADQLKC